MGGVKISAKLTFPDLAAKGMASRQEILDAVAASMQTNRGMLFNSEGQYNDHAKWKELKFRKGQILSDRGTLRRSIGPMSANGRPKIAQGSIVKFSGDTVTTGSSLIYAALMNYGGKVKAKNAQALKIPIPSGKAATADAKKLGTRLTNKDGTKTKQKFIFRKSVVVPPRDYISINKTDEKEFNQTKLNKIKEILERG